MQKTGQFSSQRAGTFIRVVLNLAIAILLPVVSAPCQTAANGADTDVGYAAVNGSAVVNGGTVTVSGAGMDIWSNGVGPTVPPVQGNYFRWAITGDGSITARVLSLTNTNQYAKAALMFSDGPIIVSFNVVTAYVIPSGQASFFNTNNTSTGAPYFPFHFPVWLRLSRTGAFYTGAASQDGVNWTTIVNAQPSRASQTVVGLAVTSHDATKLATAVFDSISFTGDVTPIPDFVMSMNPRSQTIAPGSSAALNISLSPVNGFVGPVNVSILFAPAGWSFPQSPAGVPVTTPGSVQFDVTPPASAPPGTYWTTIAATNGAVLGEAAQLQTARISISGTQADPGAGSQQDIGGPPQPGGATLLNGVLTVNASGYISANPDRLHYYYWHLTGDGSLTARLTSLTGPTSASKAGLMLRGGTGALSPYAMASAPVLGGGRVGFQLQERDSQGRAPVIYPYSFHNVPLWMRLIRTNVAITVLWSLDGVNWQQDTSSITYAFQGPDQLPATVLIGIAADANAVFDNITVTGDVTP